MHFDGQEVPRRDCIMGDVYNLDFILGVLLTKELMGWPHAKEALKNG